MANGETKNQQAPGSRRRDRLGRFLDGADLDLAAVVDPDGRIVRDHVGPQADLHRLTPAGTSGRRIDA